MKTKEKDLNYERLLALRDALRLVLDMRCYNLVLNSNASTNSTVYKTCLRGLIANYSNFAERIKRVADAQMTGLIDWSDPEIITTIIEESNRPTDSSQSNKISDLKMEIVYLEQTCPSMRSIPLEIIEFISQLNLGIDGADMKEPIEELLNSIPYENSGDIREYLTNKCRSASWYKAFYFKNPSAVRAESYNSNLDNLLKSLLNCDNPRRIGLVDSILRVGKMHKGASIDADTIKALIRAKVNGVNSDLDIVLAIIAGSNIPFSANLQSILRSVIVEFTEGLSDNTKEVFISKIFDTFRFFVDSDLTLLNMFATVLTTLSNGDMLADYLASHLTYVGQDYDRSQKFIKLYEARKEALQTEKGAALTMREVKKSPTE